MSDVGSPGRRLTVLLSCLLTSCSLFVPQLDPPEIVLKAVAVERLSLDEQRFLVRLQLRNPNARELRVADARVRLQLEGTDIGEGVILRSVSVPALGEAEADVGLTANLVAKIPEIWTWLASGDTQLDYRLTGFVDVGGVRINIDETGQVRLTDISRYTDPEV